MPSLAPATSLTITNPLVLYRALLATKKIEPDASQHRLAIHLQKLYLRLKDYSPEVDYSYRLSQLNRLVRDSGSSIPTQAEVSQDVAYIANRDSIFSSFRVHRQQKDALTLTKKLTDHESAMGLQSPQGLLLYGEVGTGKSMLVDLLADCLPNQKKRRWHFNHFMLETFARLDQLRLKRIDFPASGSAGMAQNEEHSLLWLARDMISTSPILFLDEFQLPDRATSKILSSLFTSFFHLGGVLIATSNRMPEELANASGIEFMPPPLSRLGLLGKRWGLLGQGLRSEKSENRFGERSDFVAFLDVLRARCEVWDMEGRKDWRRREAEDIEVEELTAKVDKGSEHEAAFQVLEPAILENGEPGDVQSSQSEFMKEAKSIPTKEKSLPRQYYIKPTPLDSTDEANAIGRNWNAALLQSVFTTPSPVDTAAEISWETTTIRVYGRTLIVPRHFSGVSMWTFPELCTTNLGPADYISLASTFHTFVLTDIPILTLLHKNEARRLISLLDALYEARCKLLIRAEAGPDSIFFPETQRQLSATSAQASSNDLNMPDQVYPETFSEIYQDQTSPFRPNISSYTSSASPPSYPSSHFQSTSSPNLTGRSMLADEDSDFGLINGTSTSHPTHIPDYYRGPSDGTPGAGNEIGRHKAPNFAHTGTFTGEDEKFAYKRARSRLWEMCGARWWSRQDPGWWNPLPREVRRWENPPPPASNHHHHHQETTPETTTTTTATSETRKIHAAAQEQPNSEEEEHPLFRHNASPFRTSRDAPPRFASTHAWGMVKWGRKAGVWGLGVEGVGERGRGEGKGGDAGKDRGDAGKGNKGGGESGDGEGEGKG